MRERSACTPSCAAVVASTRLLSTTSLRLTRFPLPRLATRSSSTLLVVDGDAVTSDPWVLAGIKVTAEVVDHHKGAKIDILRYKNKTGYRRRQGHRQQYTAIKVTGIPTAAK